MDLITDIEFSVLIIIEIATSIFLLLYLVFAAFVIKQVKIMTETLEVGFEGPVRALAFVHFIFALLVLFFAVIVFFIK